MPEMKHGLGLLLLLLLLLVAPPSSQGAAVFEELLRVTCDGSIHLLPSAPAGLRLQLPLLLKASSEATRILYQRATCACPHSSEQDILAMFDPFTAFLSNLSEEREPTSPCLDSFFARTLEDLDPFKLDLPHTCSMKTWMGPDKACSMKWLLPSLGAELRLSVGRCQGSFSPSISLSCEGNGCAKLLAPCTKDSDCAAHHSCLDFATLSNFVIEDMTLPEGIFELLKELVYDDTDESPGCYQGKRRPKGAKTPKNDIMTNIMTFISTLFFGNTGTMDKMAFCGLDQIFDLESEVGEGFAKPLLDQFKVSTSKVLGKESCIFSDDELITGLDKTHRIKLSFKNLRPWDGRDQTGTPVLHHVDLIPQIQPLGEQHPHQRLLAQLSCNQDLTFPSHGFGLAFEGRFRQITDHFTSLFKDLVACRSTPASTDPLVFLARYGAWAPLMWLYILDPSAKSSLPLPTESDWVKALEDPSRLVDNLPPTCNVQRLLTEGVCEFDFTGLKDLLLLDLTIRVKIEACDGGSLFSSGRVECLGEDCALFDGLNPCDQKSQCPGSLECANSLDTLAFVLHGLMDESDPSLDFLKDPSLDFLRDRDQLEDLVLNTDFVYLLLSPKLQNNTCDYPNFSLEDMTELSQANTHQCFGASQWSQDVQRTLLSLLGTQRGRNQNISHKLRFCLPAKAVMTRQNIEDWIGNLVTASGTSVKLNPAYFREPVKTEEPSPSGPPSPSGGGLSTGAVVGVAVAVILVAALVAAGAFFVIRKERAKAVRARARARSHGKASGQESFVELIDNEEPEQDS